MTTAVYEGTKLVQATPMNRLEYNQYRGWDLPAYENGADEGFLVEYLDEVKEIIRHISVISVGHQKKSLNAPTKSALWICISKINPLTFNVC